MTQEERTGWRCQEISERHRKWGWNSPAVDLDFPMIEYNFGRAVAVVEYKHHRNFEGSAIRLSGPNYKALSDFHDKDGNQHPFFVVRYWPDEQWRLEVMAGNLQATRLLNEHHAGTLTLDIALPGGWVHMSERQWVTFLHKIRGFTLAEAEAQQLSTFNRIPEADIDQAALIADILRRNLDQETLSLIAKTITEGR
jgi:hypothetical protein